MEHVDNQSNLLHASFGAEFDVPFHLVNVTYNWFMPLAVHHQVTVNLKSSRSTQEAIGESLFTFFASLA